MKGRAFSGVFLLLYSLTLAGCGENEPATDSGASGSGSVAGAGASAGGAGASSGAAGSGQASSGTGSAIGGMAASTAGTTGNDDFPPLNPMDDARKLSDADKGVLCDWVNETLGGYGLSTNCGSGITTSNDDNQAQCVATRFRYNCKVTVQEVKACTLVTAPSHACNRDFQECHALFCIE